MAATVAVVGDSSECCSGVVAASAVAVDAEVSEVNVVTVIAAAGDAVALTDLLW